MWAQLAVFKESLESDDVFLFQEIYIFFIEFTYFLGHKAPLIDFYHSHCILMGGFQTKW